MNLVRTAASPMLLTLALVACGGDDAKQAKAPTTTETTYGTTTSKTDATPSGAMTGAPMTGSGTSMNGAPNGSMPSGNTAGSAPTMNGSNGVGSTGASGMGSTGSSGMGTSGMNATTFTDAEIAAIVQTVNKGEVEEGKVAQKQAKDARVKKFAAMMVNQHQSSNTKQADMLKKLKITPSENATSRELQTDGQSSLEALKSQTGADFDKAYIDAQVREHQKVLQMLDDRLLPQAQSSELKAHLQTVRTQVDAHLREAMDIQKSLGSK